MIRVLLFGTLGTKAGGREFEIQATDEIKTASDVVRKLEEGPLKGPAGVYMLAVNETQAKPETLVKDGDEIAIMPPFSGG